MSLAAKVRPIKPEADLYHGVPVLPIKVGDPIPTPRAPERYAVRVYPDLARYFLTFNHPRNRSVRKRAVAKYAADMGAGRWWFTPEPLVFSTSGVLQNGQHRCRSVTEYGADVWMMCDFGWPDDIINAIDRGGARTNHDAFKIDSIPNATTVSAAIALVSRYKAIVGGVRGFSGMALPTAQASLAIYAEDDAGWDHAASVGVRVYSALDKGLGPTTWTAAHRIIGAVHPDKVDAFLDAVADGTEDLGSPTRKIGNWFRRRPAAATNTGDGREHLEVIVRAFNAWNGGKPMSMPRAAGFTLSRVR